MIKNKIFSIIIFIAAFVGALIFTGKAIYDYYSFNHGMLRTDLKDNTVKQMATELYFSQLEQIGQISLGLIGALWLFTMGSDRSIHLKSMAHVGLFAVTNVFFLVSFWAYFFGSDMLINLMFYHETIDFDAPIVKYWNDLQFQSFVVGLLMMVITIILGNRK